MLATQAGDSSAYGKLLEKLSDTMRKFVANSLRRTGSRDLVACEDIVQEILLTLHRHRENYLPEQAFLPWIFTIAKHKVIDYLRTQKNNFRFDWNLEVESLAASEQVDRPHVDDLEKLSRRLSEKQWRVLRLVKIEEKSVEEVSRETGFSPSDVKVTVHRAIKTLQKFARKDAL